MNIVCFFIALIASILGSICGVGGGVIIKPALDLFGIANISTISFLTSCTVLAMTGYTVSKGFFVNDRSIDIKGVSPLAIGAAAGGVIGKYLFETIKDALPFAEQVGAIQAVFLGVVALGTMLYTINKKNIKTKHLQGTVLIMVVGVALGIMSAFLGIGGGPIDLVVLLFFFSMDIKKAAVNSLYIIFFSQLFSIIYTIASRNVPEVEWITLILMIAGGIGGGMIGRCINKKIETKTVDKLFILVLTVIVLISIYNFCKYLN